MPLTVSMGLFPKFKITKKSTFKFAHKSDQQIMYNIVLFFFMILLIDLINILR